MGRSIRSKQRRKNKELVDLDITSLMDILVTLIFFLLINSDYSGVILNVPRGVELPKSISSSPNSQGVVVQVSPTSIWVDDKLVLDINKPSTNVSDHNGQRIVPLFNELVSKKEYYQSVAKSTPGVNTFSGIVNLVVDKSIKYNYLKKLMNTCAEAGFQKYKFVVMGEAK